MSLEPVSLSTSFVKTTGELKRYIVRHFESYDAMEDFINEQATTYRPVSITDAESYCAVLLERRDA